MINPSTIEVGGEVYEIAKALTARTGMSDFVIRRMMKKGMPKPVRIGRTRYFNSAKVDQWIIANAQ